METMNTDTPESNKAKIAFTSLFAGDDAYWVPFIVASKLERERDEARADAAMWKANHDNQVSLKSMLMDRPDLGDRALRIAELIRERDEICAQLREEQQLHIQTLGERDEARQWESQALVARIQRDEFSKTLGEVREIICAALPNENAPTSFMAATLVKERDEAREALETGGLLGILDRAGHDRAEAIRERDEARVIADRPVTYGASLVIPTNPSWANSPIHQEVQEWEEKSIRAQDGRICQCEDAPCCGCYSID